MKSYHRNTVGWLIEEFSRWWLDLIDALPTDKRLKDLDKVEKAPIAR
jgi:hypothetical protein